MELRQRMADALDGYFADTRRDGYIVGGVTGSEAAEAVMAAVPSWDVLMVILDENYPEDVFPTMDDREDRDIGPRIVSLIRRLHGSRSDKS